MKIPGDNIPKESVEKKFLAEEFFCQRFVDKFLHYLSLKIDVSELSFEPGLAGILIQLNFHLSIFVRICFEETSNKI